MKAILATANPERVSPAPKKSLHEARVSSPRISHPTPVSSVEPKVPNNQNTNVILLNSFANPIMLELFAGSARVTTCLRHLGHHDAFGVDNVKKKNFGKVLVARDLTTVAGQQVLWKWVKSPNCAGIFAAPPCGTCSRARDTPRYDNRGRRVGPWPLKPLKHSDGPKFLCLLDQLRVNCASCLYSFLSDVVLWCCPWNLIVCVENPRSSLYWRTSFYKCVQHFLTFSARGLATMAHNVPSGLLVRLPCGVTCSGYAAAEETAYPILLAYHIAYAVCAALVARGWKAPLSELTPPAEISYSYLRALLGTQPKASKLPPLVSEGLLIKLSRAWRRIPAGSSFMKHPPVRLKGGDNGKGGI